jgi:membrane-bound lytic murein transglycosylase D
MNDLHENQTGPSSPLAITVIVESGTAERTEFSFNHTFRIGRGFKCDIRIEDDVVSRSHAEVRFEGNRWLISDLESGNGILVDGIKVKQAFLEYNTRVQLGPEGPVLSLTVEKGPEDEKTVTSSQKESKEDPLTLTHYKNYYFGDNNKEDAGEHTMMVRRAFEQVQQKEKRKYTWIIAAVVCLSLAAGGYAIVKHMQVSKQRLLAEEIFYALKSMELEFSDVLKLARTSKDAKILEHVEAYKSKRKDMEKTYDQFVVSLNVYRKNMSKEERLILQIARVFGECEINVPEGFIKEVLNYIEKWKSTGRMERAVNLAKRKGYIPKVVKTMMAHELPPQFLYLCLQESDFNVNACGPEARFGIAKGAWQFIPSTAEQYGLRTGPMAKTRKVDPRDERHHFGKSTLAAARYIRYIYDTEAQASGLLVMASYNWGERRVIKLLQGMPKNPKERNFWRVLMDNKDKIPKQTYDYVFYIFSAAVIGENPRLFGFDFDNPLASAMKGSI